MVNQLRRIFQSSNLQSIARTEGLKASQGMTQGIRSGQNGAVGAARELANGAIQAIESANMYNRAYQVGLNFANGMIAGIQAKANRIAQQAAATVTNAINAANAAQQARSPAKKTVKVGQNWGGGIVVGIEDMQPKVDKAAGQTMISAMDAAARKATLAQMRAAMDNITIRTWQAKQAVSNPQALLSSIYSNNGAMQSYDDSEFVKAVQELANRPIYTDLYINGRKICRSVCRRCVTSATKRNSNKKYDKRSKKHMSKMYSVKFNDIELGNYIYVLQGFTPFVGVSWAPSLVNTYGKFNGARFQYQKYGSKIFSMPFSMEADSEMNLKEKYDSLQRILNVIEPVPLIFEKTPDRYCLAIPSGNLEFDQILETGEGTITWIVPDGVAHSTVEKVFTARSRRQRSFKGDHRKQRYGCGTN